MMLIKMIPAVAVAAAAGTAMADHLPRTLNFEDQTVRVNQTVAENTGNNVKAVDAGDFDKNGYQDVAVAIAGGVFGLRLNKLYLNNGGVFTEVSGTAVIPGFATIDLSRAAYFRDFDQDTWLDLLIANDDLSNGGPYKLYMNQHAGGVFTHFTEEGALRGLGFEASCGSIAEDVDGDLDVDIYSGNYPSPSQDTLFLNNGAGFFTVVTGTHVPSDSDYTIDVAAADMNGDGKLDLLVSNENDPYWIYYNDLLDQADQGEGDYRYGVNGMGGTQNFGSSGDGALEPGDFNNDNRMDFYWTNKVGATGDRILVNTGNDIDGKAMFTEIAPPPYTTSVTGHKIVVRDLNGDGRPELLVGTNGRPAVLRNTSVNNTVSYVDWTPAPAFPSGATHAGHHAALFDTNNDGDVDIFFGAVHDDHIFENVASNELNENDIEKGALPNVLNTDPIAVEGQGSASDPDEFVLTGLTMNATLCVIVNGTDDYNLEVLDATDSVVASSDRGGIGIEEALEIIVPSMGTFRARVSVLAAGTLPGDFDHDGLVSSLDLLELLGLFGSNCPGFPDPCPWDMDFNGSIDVFDLLAFLAVFGNDGGEYVLEVLSRTG